MQCLNKAFWLAAASHVTSFNLLKCFISAQHTNANLKNVYDIDSCSTGLDSVRQSHLTKEEQTL